MKVFITGGSGSLGMALLAYYEQQGHSCTVYSRDEVKQSEARRLYPRHRFVLGDVRDRDWLEICMRGHELVVHAAAYKQIPSAEANVGEAIETNVVGSRNVAMAAVRADVRRVVGVSTDKACEPVNAYGATKALMEKLFQQANTWASAGDNGTTFTLVRYGNVLYSRGSVVPLLVSQVKQGQRLTITDESMTRFWLTMDDAVALVGMAAKVKTAGVIMVPKARASTMLVMAKAVLRKYIGTDADVDAASNYRVIGTRPGEKKHEKLIHLGEAMHTEVTPSVMLVHPPSLFVSAVMSEEYTSDKAEQLTVSQLCEML